MKSPEDVMINKRPSKSRREKPAKKKMDMIFFFIVLGLMGGGFVMMASASYVYALYYYNNSYYFITKQLMFDILGFVAMFAVSRVDYHVLKKFHLPWIAYGISVLLLIYVYFKPATSDYRRWISLGFTTFQPSEVAKFAIILLFSYLISKEPAKILDFKRGILPLAGLLGVLAALIVIEPHLSATILICSIAIVIMVVGGMKIRWLLMGGGAVIAAGAFAILTGIVDYGASRITNWLDPWSDATGKGYQTIQSLLAIGSGGLLGRGLGQSRQKYLWVPEPHNDFIFAIVCEELGLIGALCVIVGFGLLVWRGIVIAIRANDRFGSLLTVGIIVQVGLQAVLNILVVTNTIPNTGISLPFFSYGGTSLTMIMAQMGIVLSVSRYSTVKKN